MIPLGLEPKTHVRFGRGKKKRDSHLAQVIPLGLEPKTHSLEGCCSIQLSYGTIQIGCKISVFFVAIQII